MAKRIVECVPNISEGRDKSIIDACAQAAAAVEGCTLLDVDPGADTNRTVITLAGNPEAVLEGAFQLIAMSHKLIDMTKHSGAHPRAGATDVCPFVPVRGLTMEECVAFAHQLGERVGRELSIPVYLYESAAITGLKLKVVLFSILNNIVVIQKNRNFNILMVYCLAKLSILITLHVSVLDAKGIKLFSNSFFTF